MTENTPDLTSTPTAAAHRNDAGKASPTENHGQTDGDTRVSIASIAMYAARRVEVAEKGDLAVLRRLPLKGYNGLPEIFWSVVSAQKIPQKDEIFWADIMSMMASTPNSNTRVGKALYAADIKPTRVERWLRLTKPEARVECTKLLRRISGGVSWASLASALYWWSDDDRRAIARDYFTATPVAEERPSDA